MRKHKLSSKQGWWWLLVVAGLMLSSFLWQKAKNSVWDGKSFIGIVYKLPADYKLVTIIPDMKQNYSWIIPGNTMMPVAEGFGEYQLKNVYNLGKLDKRGGELLIRTLQTGLGIPVSAWQIGADTNLTWWDKIRIKLTEMKNLKKKTVDLRTAGLEERLLSDNTPVYQLNQTLTDSLVNELLFDETMIKEGLSLAIVNASGVDGEAKTAARLVANLGGEVRMVGNQEPQDQSEIFVAQEQLLNSKTVKRLSQIFKITKISVGIQNDWRSQVAIIIAKDYTQAR